MVGTIMGHFVDGPSIKSCNLWGSAANTEPSCILRAFCRILSDRHIGSVRFTVKLTKLKLPGLFAYMGPFQDPGRDSEKVFTWSDTFVKSKKSKMF